MSSEPQLKRQHAIDALEAAERIFLERMKNQPALEKQQIHCRLAIKRIYRGLPGALHIVRKIETDIEEAQESLTDARLCLESLINMREVV